MSLLASEPEELRGDWLSESNRQWRIRKLVSRIASSKIETTRLIHSVFFQGMLVGAKTVLTLGFVGPAKEIHEREYNKY